MILAAGRGERMRPLTDTVPKPLLTVAGEPLIVRMLRALRGAGVRQVVVNVSHLAAQIEQALGDGGRYGVAIRYSREEVALETAGGIALALPLLGTGPFIVANADVCTDFDFGRLRTAIGATSVPGRLAHLVLVDNPAHHPDGDFALDAGGLVRENGQTRLTFAGIGVYEPVLFSGVSRGSRAQLAPLLRAAMQCDAVSGERHSGLWADVGTPARLAELNARVHARGVGTNQTE